MGSHAGADLAWGVDISDEDHEGFHESLGEDFDYWSIKLEELFGFTVVHPTLAEGAWPAHGTPERDAFEAKIDAWCAALDRAVPVEFMSTGSDYAEFTRVIIKRSHVNIYECGEVEEVTYEHTRPPTTEEIAAVNKVLDHIGFTGDRTLKFQLATSWG